MIRRDGSGHHEENVYENFKGQEEPTQN